MKKLFALGLLCHRVTQGRPISLLTASYVLAQNRDEAMEIGINKIMKEYSQAAGWENYACATEEIQMDIIYAITTELPTS